MPNIPRRFVKVEWRSNHNVHDTKVIHMVRTGPAEIQLLLDFDAVKPSLEQLMSPDEVFEQADEGLLRRMGEDRRIERKPASYSGSSLGEYVCMWANTPPDGGLIIVGMLNDGGFEVLPRFP